ncbi:MAG: response regulator [Oligoflexia bacterium]|nr:response regulator [Oligoflexia bacterium]
MEKKKYTLMLVDDEDIILNALKGAFEDDYNIITAVSGEEALSKIAKEQFEIIICDMRMPGIQGYDVLKSVVAKDQSIRRILLTGFSDEKAAQAAIDLGKIHQYKSKPINLIELGALLKTELQQYEKDKDRDMDRDRGGQGQAA